MRKQASLIFLLRVIRLAFAILNLSFSAKYFGVSLERDVWLLAFNAILILDIAIWAPVNDTFRSKFLQVKQDHGEPAALYQTKGLLIAINIVTLVLVVLIEIFPEPVAKMLAPAYKEPELQSLSFMIRLLAPSFLINQFAKILTSVLNTYNSFIIPEVTGLFIQILTLVVILTLSSSIGISALAISYYGGLIFWIVLLTYHLQKLQVNIFQDFFKTSIRSALPFLLFSLPFFLPHFSSQISQIVEKSLASTTIGAVSILEYSRKFSDIPIDVLIGIFASMMVPVLTLRYTQKDKKGFFEEFRKIYQFGFLIVAVVISLLTACPGAIVDFLYHKGSISESSLRQITQLTRYYSWAGFGIFLYHSFGLSLLSSGKGKWFAIYGTMAQLIMIGINIICYKQLYIYTFPLSLGISHLIAAMAMCCYFPVKNRKLLIVSFKYTFLVILTTILLYLVNQYLLPFQNPILIIVFNMFALLVLLTGIIFASKMEEKEIIVRYFKKWTSHLSL